MKSISSKKTRGISKSKGSVLESSVFLGAASALIWAPEVASAQEGVSGISKDIGSVTQNADGSWRVLLSNGNVVTLSADQVTLLADGSYLFAEAAMEEISLALLASGSEALVALAGGGALVAAGAGNAADADSPPDATISGETDVTAAISGNAMSARGQLSVSDPDASEAAIVAQNDIAGIYGTFSINPEGAWSYSADLGSALINFCSFPYVCDSFRRNYIQERKNGAVGHERS